MFNNRRRSGIGLLIPAAFISLVLAFLAGCTGVIIRDTLPPSAPKGYADFANYTPGYDVIYSLINGKKVREGSLGFEGATLRIARTPGNYDFIIEHEDGSDSKISKRVTVKVERDMLTFVTIDQKIHSVIEGIYDRKPTTTVRYDLIVSLAKNPAPLRRDAGSTDMLNSLFNDPDWRARLYAVNSLKMMKNAAPQELIKRAGTLAIDDPHKSVRQEAAALLKDRGIDPFKNILFLENFEANNKRRWISSNGRYDYFYNDEFLFTSPSDACENEMLTFPLELPGAFDLELQSTWQSGSDGEAYGILIGSDMDNFNYFGISAKGEALVRPIRTSEASADLIASTDVPAIKRRGAGANQMRVEVRGNTWKYFVNNAPVGTIANTMTMDKYVIGLRVCQGQTIAFDQLKISLPPEN